MCSLVPDYGDSSPESSEDSDNDSAPEGRSSPPATAGPPGRLPPPTFSDKVKNSIFSNPYLEAENAKIAVLETHVKSMPPELEESDPTTRGGKGSKVCYMFKRGKCKYGKKCRFSHHIHTNSSTTTTLSKGEDGTEPSDPAVPLLQQSIPPDHPPPSQEDEGSDEESKKRKKRPGLTRGLIPSKKVIKLYKKHKKEDGKS